MPRRECDVERPKFGVLAGTLAYRPATRDDVCRPVVSESKTRVELIHLTLGW
jgi:hypothetical protein